MTTYIQILKSCMEDTAMRSDAVAQALLFCQTRQRDELVRFLHMQRCILVEQMHESQQKVDRMDYLIRLTKITDF